MTNSWLTKRWKGIKDYMSNMWYGMNGSAWVYILFCFLSKIFQMLPAFEKVHRTHFYCYLVKTDYNIIIDIKFQLSLFRKNILIFVNLF